MSRTLCFRVLSVEDLVSVTEGKTSGLQVLPPRASKAQTILDDRPSVCHGRTTQEYTTFPVPQAVPEDVRLSLR